MQKLKELVYYYGHKTGIVLIILPMAWDVLFMGARDILHWSICPWGMGCQLVGIILMCLGGRDAK